MHGQGADPYEREIRRFGDETSPHLSDFAPGTKKPAQLSREFLGMPFQGSRFTHFVEIDVTGLNVIADPAGNYVSGWQLGAEQLEGVLTTGRLY